MIYIKTTIQHRHTADPFWKRSNDVTARQSRDVKYILTSNKMTKLHFCLARSTKAHSLYITFSFPIIVLFHFNPLALISTYWLGKTIYIHVVWIGKHLSELLEPWIIYHHSPIFIVRCRSLVNNRRHVQG